MMMKEDRILLNRIDHGVEAFCDEKGWKKQIRRAWCSREIPESDLLVDHYEWKIFPGAHSVSQDCDLFDFEGEGIYYVMSFQLETFTVRVQHSGSFIGDVGSHRACHTYTEFNCYELKSESFDASGFIQNLDYICRNFPPNHFSYT